MLEPRIRDADFALYLGDVRAVLSELPDESVDCVVTSPPYWGLRDYGTGEWEGGDPDCDHLRPPGTMNLGFNERWGQGAGARKQETKSNGQYRETCAKCGARRLDLQLGLEATPDEYVANLVAVFREARRVLASHGTVWLNLGDSYNNRSVSRVSSHQTGLGFESDDLSKPWAELTQEGRTRLSIADGVLKEKDLVGVPWKVAFALQADGWWLRSDIIWAKPNPMPSSVTDRPTVSHEYVFLLAKSARYYFDQQAVREPATWERWSPRQTAPKYGGRDERASALGREWTEDELARYRELGRNVRTVWEIPTQPYPDAHFATYPEELVRRAILAGTPAKVCRRCGAPRERIVEIDYVNPGNRSNNGRRAGPEFRDTNIRVMDQGRRLEKRVSTEGWTDCGHDDYRAGIVLDPFLGSGTTAVVARAHARACIGIELNPDYADLIARRTSQLSLFSGGEGIG